MAAATIAQSGYVIELQPKVEGSKRPDYRIEGEIFDCYSPTSHKGVRGMATAMRTKIDDKQTQRIVLNLDDWLGDVKDIVKQLNDYPISGLKEVLVVRNGEVTHIYP